MYVFSANRNEFDKKTYLEDPNFYKLNSYN